MSSLLFALHRGMIFGPLLKAGYGPGISPGRAYLVGVMSDFWVALLLGMVVGALIGSLGWVARSHRLVTTSLFGFSVVFGFLAAGHQVYVDFFKFPIIPFHLRYLSDQAFLLSNARSLLGPSEIATVIAPVGMAVGLNKTRFFQTLTLRQVSSLYATMVLAGLLLHNRNIHYREQWFVPETLQVNPIERLYMQYTSQKHPQDLSIEDLRKLAVLMDKQPESSSKISWQGLFSVLTDPPGLRQDLPAIALALRDGFLRRIELGRRPVVMIALLESMRPAETGYFANIKEPAASLTPFLDTLVEQGINFSNAYSTGSVTRGGQEAVLCGYIGSRDTSLMRGAAVTSWDCLPRLVSGEASTFWYHGGEGLFDQQEAFWKEQGVHDLMTMMDFASDAPRTSWGVGDATFFRAVIPRIVTARNRSQGSYLLGMALSLSNHIPWDLPADMPPDLKANGDRQHGSYLTTAYTDRAVGEFVQKLKEENIWKDLVMIVTSDHGNTIEPYHDIYRDSRNQSGRLQSHIQLFLIGGLVEEALASEGLKKMEIRHTVSQADVATLVADLIGIQNKRFFATNPFAPKRDIPVFSILEEELFFPDGDEAWVRSTLKQSSALERTPEAIKTQLYYRGFMQFIGMPNPQT